MNLKEEKQKAIIVVSFGTTYLETLAKNIEKCEEDIKETFKEYDIKRAFTSKIIRAILEKKHNLKINSLEEAILECKLNNYKEVIIAPLHLMPGKEFDDVKNLFNKYKELNYFTKFNLARPLMYRQDDFDEVIEALLFQVPTLKENEGAVFMGHGSYHPGNAVYSQLQHMLEKKNLNNFLIGTIEGFPYLEDILDKIKKIGIKKVVLSPLLLVCGDHGLNDMAGQDEDSWLNVLKKEGIDVVPYKYGLGENEKIRQTYIKRIKDAINGENLYLRH